MKKIAIYVFAILFVVGSLFSLSYAENENLSRTDIKASHPKLMINSKEDLLDKIDTDEFTKAQYSKVLEKADLTVENRSGSNYDANSVLIEFTSLAAAYLYEANTSYFDVIFEKLTHSDVLKYFSNYEPLGSNIATLAVATVYDWLYADLSQSQKNLCLELIENGLELNREYIDAENEWTVSEHNINTIANSCIIIAAAAVSEELPEISEFYLEKCSENLANHLGQYTNGPAFNEGPHYWVYATAYLSAAGAAMDTALNKSWVLFDKIVPSNIGEYGIYMCSPTGECDFNYADSPYGRRIYGMPQMLYFSKKYNNSAYGYVGKKQCKRAAESRFPSDVWSVLMYDSENCASNIDYISTDAYLNGRAEIISMRSSWEEDAVFLAAKGGNNNFSHSHLDAGDFSLSAGGERFVEQLGWEDYGKVNMFRGIMGNDNPRYKYFLNSAEGQNTFLINPESGAIQQKAENTAEVIKFETNSTVAYGVFDLSGVYSDALYAKRGYKLYKNEKIAVLRDEVTLNKSGNYWWGIYTEANVALSEDARTAFLNLNGQRMAVKLISGGEFELRNAQPLYPGFARLDNSEITGIKRLTVCLENVTEAVCEVAFSYVNTDGSYSYPVSGENNLQGWSLLTSVSVAASELGSLKTIPGYDVVSATYNGVSDSGNGSERDADLTTYRQINKDSAIIYDLGKVKEVGAVGMAFRRGQNLHYRFEIYTSSDGTSYRRVARGRNSGKTYQEEIYEIIPTKARYVKIVYRGCEEAESDRGRLSFIAFFENANQAENEMQQRIQLAPDKLNVLFSKTTFAIGETIEPLIGAVNCYGVNMERVPDAVWIHSDNTSVAITDGRKISANGCGTAMITVSAKYGDIVLQKEQRIYVTSENGVILPIMEDSTVNSTNNTYGNEDTVYAKNSSIEQYVRRGYMKIDTDISDKENIKSAKLWLYAYDENNSDDVKLAAYQTSTDWEENTICNKNAPVLGDCIGVSEDILSSAPRWVSIDVTDFIKSSDTSAALAMLQEKGKSKTSVIFSCTTQYAPYVEVYYDNLPTETVVYLEKNDDYDVIFVSVQDDVTLTTERNAIGYLDENIIFHPLQKAWFENGAVCFQTVNNGTYVLYDNEDRYDDKHIITVNARIDGEKAVLRLKSFENEDENVVSIPTFYEQGGNLITAFESETVLKTGGEENLLYADIPEGTKWINWFVWESKKFSPLVKVELQPEE